MASRFTRRMLASATRPAARASAASARMGGRRFASADAAHSAKVGSDTPWMVGSALVFGPVVGYLLMPQSKDKAKHAAEHKHAKPGISELPEPTTHKEEPTPSEAEVEDSANQAVVSDSPKDAQAAEEDASAPSDDGKVHGAPELTDSEGTTASAEEVDESMKLAFKSNSPQDAQREEAHDATYNDGAPGQTSEAEKKPDQKEHPGKSDKNEPTQQADARKTAKSSQAPKQWEQKSQD